MIKKISYFSMMLFYFLLGLPVNANWEQGMNIVNDVSLPGGNLMPAGPIWILFSFFLWLLKIFLILAVISFVIAGITFLLSGVNPNLRERAKDGITYSIIAIVVTFSSVMIIATVIAILTGTAFVDLIL